MGESKFYDFHRIGKYVESTLAERSLCKKVLLTQLHIKDPTDHNEIYPKLLKYLESVQKSGFTYTAAISSGTPSMQACWILIAESGAFPLKLVRSDDPKWGVPVVRKVKLSAALPRIEKIKKENTELKKSALEVVKIDKKKPEIRIGEKVIDLTPIEFVYYRFFAERARRDEEHIRFGGLDAPKEFFEKILDFHKESYPESDGLRMTLEKNGTISCSTFRANVTRLNKKFKSAVSHKFYSQFYLIESEGKRYAKRYCINLPPESIKIK
ncbi:MAG: hypothetical protein IPL67_05260 [Ignavibacteria bacterium]|nr:hypothetical protein [Ignavibacteria bacterium]